MKGLKVGYVRVSTLEQNTERQLQGLVLDKVFIDKISGKDINRDQFKMMMEFLREGDTIHVHSMDRLARNLDDLRRTVQTLVARGIIVKFITENLTFDGNDSPMSILYLSIMGAFAEFERSIFRERQREGIAIAKTKGVYKGRKRTLNQEQVEQLMIKLHLGFTKGKIAKLFNISRRAVYDYIELEKIRLPSQAQKDLEIH